MCRPAMSLADGTLAADQQQEEQQRPEIPICPTMPTLILSMHKADSWAWMVTDCALGQRDGKLCYGWHRNGRDSNRMLQNGNIGEHRVGNSGAAAI